jgi:hypothetical protein
MSVRGMKRILGLALVAGIASAVSQAQATTTFTQVPSSGYANPVTTTSSASSSGTGLSGATIYASQGIAASSNGSSLVIPNGLAVTITSSAATTADEATGVLTFTLPAGVTFVTTPTATLLSTATSGSTTVATGPIKVGGVSTGTLGSNGRTLSFKLTTAAQSAASSSQIQLGVFTVTGAVAMTTPGNSLAIQAITTGFTTNGTSTILLNDTAAITGTIAVAASGVNGQAQPGPGDTIAIATGSIGTGFNSYDVAAATGATTATALSQVADLGKVAVAANTAALNPGTSAAQYSATNTGTLSVTGTFSNYTATYLSTGSVCTQVTPPTGAIVGTISSTALTFPNVPLSGALQAICLVSSGTSLLSPTGPLTATFTIGGQTQVLSSLGTTGVVYSGTPFNLTYVFSRVANYQGYLRLVNTTSVSQPVFGIARNDSGQVVAGLMLTLAPQSAQLLAHDEAFRLIGATSIFPSGTRGVLTALTPAPAIGSAIPGVSSGNAAGVSVTSIVVNPTTDLTNVY